MAVLYWSDEIVTVWSVIMVETWGRFCASLEAWEHSEVLPNKSDLNVMMAHV
ncbi:hypothetical protein [Salipaludibacillus neizhouensis]|uniref:hypothetical protein n=1 Tax=Salipaludibacillus neizhouensis TaxID=885475 RepID=UPI0016002A5F|nr:hypothetical protein [Salipaludibacillus neizhouensis]